MRKRRGGGEEEEEGEEECLGADRRAPAGEGHAANTKK